MHLVIEICKGYGVAFYEFLARPVAVSIEPPEFSAVALEGGDGRQAVGKKPPVENHTRTQCP